MIGSIRLKCTSGFYGRIAEPDKSTKTVTSRNPTLKRFDQAGESPRDKIIEFHVLISLQINRITVIVL